MAMYQYNRNVLHPWLHNISNKMTWTFLYIIIDGTISYVLNVVDGTRNSISLR